MRYFTANKVTAKGGVACQKSLGDCLRSCKKTELQYNPVAVEGCAPFGGPGGTGATAKRGSSPAKVVGEYAAGMALDAGAAAAGEAAGAPAAGAATGGVMPVIGGAATAPEITRAWMEELVRQYIIDNSDRFTSSDRVTNDKLAADPEFVRRLVVRAVAEGMGERETLNLVATWGVK